MLKLIIWRKILITEITVGERTRWNNIVRSFENYEVFYLNEYVTAFENYEVKNGVPVLLYYENGSDRAIYTFFKRDIANDPNFLGKLEERKYFDLISPYGYGGWMGEIENYAALNAEYNSYCLEHSYISEFIRFNLFSDYQSHYDGTVETHTHNVVRSLDLPLDEMWMNFKQNVRKNVKRANKNGLTVIIDEGEHINDHLSDFLHIYYATMDRTNAEDDYYFDEKFYRNINKMTSNAAYFHTVNPVDGKIISTELIIYGGENAYSYLGGTDKEYFNLRPNDILKYEIIKWCQNKGLKNFVFGGGYGSDDGIFEYKKHFAPNGIVNFYIGKKILDEEKYEGLCKIRGIETDQNSKFTGFFPRYRR